MRVFVGGSLRDVARDAGLCREFVAALGAEIVKQGHVLLNGCRSSLDQEIATAAHDWLVGHSSNPRSKLISYCLKTDKPVHSLGTDVTGEYVAMALFFWRRVVSSAYC